MGITSNWLQIERITPDYISFRTGNLGAANIQPRSSLLHSAAADEQRCLPPHHQQAQIHGPFYDWAGELLCQYADSSRGTGR